MEGLRISSTVRRRFRGVTIIQWFLATSPADMPVWFMGSMTREPLQNASCTAGPLEIHEPDALSYPVSNMGQYQVALSPPVTCTWGLVTEQPEIG